MYELLTAAKPFSGSCAYKVLRRVAAGELADAPSALIPMIPPAVDQLIGELMSPDPEDRPEDAAAAGRALRSLAAEQSHG